MHPLPSPLLVKDPVRDNTGLDKETDIAEEEM
jgi:hypothetical protein